MSDDSSDDLWANTAPAGQPRNPRPEDSSDADPTTVLPVTGSPSSTDPTAILPTTPTGPPLGGGGPGGGGPGGGQGGGTGGSDEYRVGPDRPAWMVPAAIAMVVGLLGAMIVVLLLRNDDGSDDASTSTLAGIDTAPVTDLVDTTITPDTTVATETTTPTESTAPADSVADTTIVETTTVPTTAAPDTTAAPTTTEAPVESTEPARPGFARIDGTESAITTACVTLPLEPNSGDYQVVSYLIDDGGPGTIVEQWFDEGSTGGNYFRQGDAVNTRDFEVLGDAGFAFAAGEGSVALNPSGITPTECTLDGVVVASPPEAPNFPYTRAFVDGCRAPGEPLTVVGYLSEGGRVQFSDNGDATATVRYQDIDLQGATDPVAVLSDGGRRIDAAVTGATIEEDVTVSLAIEVDSSTLRECADGEVR